MQGRVDVMMGFNTQNAQVEKPENNSFRIYILGDFSGRSDISWAQRKIRRIDIDNFDRVMNQIRPIVEVDSGVTIQIDTIDGFHPDLWLEKVQSLADLQKLKKQLSNPETAGQAAAKIQAYLQPGTEKGASVQPQEIEESREDMLQRLLGDKPENSSDRTDTVDRLIDQVISPYIKKEADPQFQVLIEMIDSLISQFLKAILHRQDFQELESLWRATEALVNEETGDDHHFYLVDISQAEILAASRQNSHALEQVLTQHVLSGEEEQDVLIIGDYCFSENEEDKKLLKFCSGLAKACNGCFLGGVDNSLIERDILCESEKFLDWTQYRNELFLDRVILSYPRYLLRLPYGKKRDPIDTFEFEECPGIPQAGELLWGNPAFICARVLTRTAQGQKEEDFYFSDVPAFSFEREGEPVLQPGTETLLNEAQANVLMSKGIMPLIGFRQRQGFRLMAILTLSKHI